VRTTLTLDPDVAAKLKNEARRHGISFKEAVNSNLRRGLDLDQARHLADRLEGEEVLRKISVGK
jgi:hypothetical protein